MTMSGSIVRVCLHGVTSRDSDIAVSGTVDSYIQLPQKSIGSKGTHVIIKHVKRHNAKL